MKTFTILALLTLGFMLAFGQGLGGKVGIGGAAGVGGGVGSGGGATLTLNHTSLPTSGGTGSPQNFTITSTTGNMILIGTDIDEGGTVTGCSDNKSNSYTLNATNSSDATNSSGKGYFCYTNTTATTAVTQVTITYTGGARGVESVIYDLTGPTGGVTVGAISPTNAQTSAHPAPAISAGGAGFTAVVIPSCGGPNTGVNSPFTFDVFDSGALACGGSAAHDVNSAGGTLTATTTGGSITSWDSLIIYVY
jgi:hypothetical protein